VGGCVAKGHPSVSSCPRSSVELLSVRQLSLDSTLNGLLKELELLPTQMLLYKYPSVIANMDLTVPIGVEKLARVKQQVATER
jgi:hypothetical protein